MRCPLPSTKDIFMPGQFTFEALKNQVADGTIDTVLACFVDMQGPVSYTHLTLPTILLV